MATAARTTAPVITLKGLRAEDIKDFTWSDEEGDHEGSFTVEGLMVFYSRHDLGLDFSVELGGEAEAHLYCGSAGLEYQPEDERAYIIEWFMGLAEGLPLTAGTYHAEHEDYYS